MRFSKKQRKLVEELTYLMDILNVSTDVEDADPQFLTTRLELAKRRLVISEVLIQYLLMDEYLSDVICRQFFPRRTYPLLWRTKRFRDFNFYVLERLFLVQKTDYVRARIKMPPAVHKNLLALNDLRNALAHSFFPENRRVKPNWKGIDIFSIAGFEQFIHDMSDSSDFFIRRM